VTVRIQRFTMLAGFPVADCFCGGGTMPDRILRATLSPSAPDTSCASGCRRLARKNCGPRAGTDTMPRRDVWLRSPASPTRGNDWTSPGPRRLNRSVCSPCPPEVQTPSTRHSGGLLSSRRSLTSSMCVVLIRCCLSSGFDCGLAACWSLIPLPLLSVSSTVRGVPSDPRAPQG